MMALILSGFASMPFMEIKHPCTLCHTLILRTELKPPYVCSRCSNHKYAVLENWSIATVKFGSNKAIFVAIPSNSNHVTLVKSGCK
jgi:hypothetical protein